MLQALDRCPTPASVLQPRASPEPYLERARAEGAFQGLWTSSLCGVSKPRENKDLGPKFKKGYTQQSQARLCIQNFSESLISSMNLEVGGIHIFT